MAIFKLFCNICNTGVDFKYKSKFDRVNKSNFLCVSCKKNLSLRQRIRQCPKCKTSVIYQSPSARNRAENKKAICRNCCSNQIPIKFTSFQEEIVNGLLLGDGSIPDTKRLYKRLSITRQVRDKDYLFWQYEILKDFFGTEPKYFKSYHNKAKKYYDGYACRTKSGELFRDLYDKWYKNGKKIVPSDLALTPYTLLIWFLDDGCVIQKNENHVIIKLSTDGFMRHDVEFLQQLLCRNFDIKLNIYRNGTGFILKGSTENARKFISVIDGIFPLCMLRKRTWNIPLIQ